MKDIVVIPTYNEKDNVGPMIEAIGQIVPDADVLICDDSSPDGTGEIVKESAKTNPKLFLSSGPSKAGLGRAYVRGFTWTIEQNYDRIAHMDCDFSHDPKVLPKLFAALDEYDFAIGSRYVPGGGTVNWPWYRKLISKGGSLYARTILGESIDDFTGGFKAWRRQTLIDLDLKSLTSNGYAFSLEMNYLAAKMGKRYTQIPIIFEDRRVGETKMSKAIFLEAVVAVWRLRFRK